MSRWKVSTGKTWENMLYAAAETTNRGFSVADPGKAVMPHLIIKVPGFHDLEFRKGTSLENIFDETWNRIRPQRGGDSDYLRDVEVAEEIPGGKRKRKGKKRIPKKYRDAPYDVIERIVYNLVHVERFKIHFRNKKGRFAVRSDFRLRGIDGRFVSGKAKR